jgi:hypothetical protein
MTDDTREIPCLVEMITLPNDVGEEVPSLRMTCSACGHVVECFGRRGRSKRRCLTEMASQCPQQFQMNNQPTKYLC